MIIMNNKFLMKIIWLNELFIDLFFKELRWHPEEVAGINLTHMFNLEGWRSSISESVETYIFVERCYLVWQNT